MSCRGTVTRCSRKLNCVDGDWSNEWGGFVIFTVVVVVIGFVGSESGDIKDGATYPSTHVMIRELDFWNH